MIQSGVVASAAFVGAIVGQFTFGYYANRLGLEFGLALALFLCTVSH